MDQISPTWPATPLRVALFEDNRDFADALAALLQRAGLCVIIIEPSPAMLEQYADQEFDLVITDVIMPKMDGLEVIREILQYWPRVPIIAISGGSSKLPSNLALKLSESFGADKILYKPFMAVELFAAIAELIPSFSAPPGRLADCLLAGG